MHVRLRWFPLVLVLLLLQAPVSAQQPVAAVIQITFAGVQLQRANTEGWLPLPVDAQAPFGIGDTLRTDKTGRALITFVDAAQTLVMPGTEYKLEAFDQTDKQQINITARLLKGRTIQQIIDASKVASYQVNLQHMTLQKPTALFATQVLPDASSDVIVAQGSLTASKGTDAVKIQAGNGLRATDTLGEIRPITPPQGFSFLSVTSKTCVGTANATLPGEESVAVRIGPGEDYLNLGNIPNGSPVPVIGKAESGQRYLTPYLSSFGWMIANGIILSSCDTIPIVPAVAQPIDGVINPQPFEMDLLTPFFGTPAQNVQFYVYQ
jgi:hypothetical protein